MQDVLWMCDRVCSSADGERAGQLGKLVLGRLHAASFKKDHHDDDDDDDDDGDDDDDEKDERTREREEERSQVTGCLARLHAFGVSLPVLPLLMTGDGEQRLRVLEAAAPPSSQLPAVPPLQRAGAPPPSQLPAVPLLQ